MVFLELVKKYFPNDLYIIIRNFNPLKTKYHLEEYSIHCEMTGFKLNQIIREKYPGIYQEYSFKVLNDYNMFHLIGFFHDIGKPFSVKNVKNKQKMNGHAQIGAYLISRIFKYKINKDILNIIVQCIDNHMSREFIQNVNLLDSKCLSILKCLFYADSISRQTEHINNIKFEDISIIINNIFDTKFGKIIIFPLGLQCTGKTTISKKIKNMYYDSIHIERDSILFKLSEFKNYREAYKDVHSTKKEELQKMFKNMVQDALLSEKKIIIIDTVMTLYPGQFDTLIRLLSNEAIEEYWNSFKIGIYLFPQHQLGIEDKIEYKVYKTYPDNSISFPYVKGEVNDGFLDIGTGNVENIYKIINVILSNTKQKRLIELVKYKTLDDIVKRFSNRKISFVKEYDNIIVFKYRESFQINSGITKDIRGEVLYEKDNKYYLLRGSYPVFSEVNILEEQFFQSGYKDIIATPKFDGSLVNVTFIHKSDILYNELLNINNNYATDNGFYFFGSKFKFIVTDERMITKIKKTMKDIIGKIDKITTYIVELTQFKRINYQFEIMVDTEEKELTVFYDKCFYKLLSYIIFNDDTKKIVLPDKYISENIDCIEQNHFSNIHDLNKFIQESYDKLLHGDKAIEPEGYVLHFVYDNDVILYKYKYQEFYVAHKPYKNPEKTTNVLNNMNLCLKQRFNKFRKIKKYSCFKESFLKEFEPIRLIVNNNKNNKKQLFEALSNEKDQINKLEEYIKNNCFNKNYVKKTGLIKIIMNYCEDSKLEDKILDLYFQPV